MKWKYSWIATCLTMWSSTMAMAQVPVPFGNSGGLDFPSLPQGPTPPVAPPYSGSLPQLPYGPGGPTSPNGPGFPYAPPMPPNRPNGANMPPGFPYAPPMPPNRPNGANMPNGNFRYDGNGPKRGAAEPYLVPPEATPTPRQPYPTPPGSVLTEPTTSFVPFGGSSEPYTMYEGSRYMAEVRQDDTHVWVQANFIHWWVRRDRTPPLVTTGDPGLGTLGAPDTRILLGGGGIGPNQLTGLQATVGMWLDEERLQAIEISGFWLGKRSRQYSFASDATGTPALSQPMQFPAEGTLSVSLPGVLAGSLSVHNVMDFHGAELNIARNLVRLYGWSVDSFYGVRYLYLNDTLTLNQNITTLIDGFPFNNAGQPTNSNFVFNDSFNLTNRFYGGQFGARVNWVCCRFDLGATFKLGLGATTHTSVIDGSTTLNATNGATTTLSGGSLAQASNIGRTTTTDFSIVPEMNGTVGFQISPHIRVLAGYSLLYWTRVERAGNQIDRQIDLRQVPTNTPFTPGLVGTNPLFLGNRSDFWAQGINLGLELRY